MPAVNMEDLVSLAKRRGFIFQSSMIYGGLQGVYDFGPLGVELKNHLKQRWWRDMVYERDDIEGLDSAILSQAMVFKYSGHEDTFTDPMVDCKTCKLRWRSDHISDHCPSCKSKDLTEARPFNLMFKTQVGPLQAEGATAYLRPETAQGIFTNFKNVLDSTSRQIPFGIAQMGKSFRNEITPRQFIFRVREFEQMELEFFVEPYTDDFWHEYWVDARYKWWLDQGLSSQNLRKQIQLKEELSHYSKATTDLLYAFAHGFEELEGIANRTDYDLGSHSKEQSSLNLKSDVMPNMHSTQKLAFRRQNGDCYVPYVIEPSAGVERGVLAVLSEAYTFEKDPVERIVLKLKPHLAPVKAAVIPLARNKLEQVDLAAKITKDLRLSINGRVSLENTGNIGKSYRKHDEIGTPCCLTVDFDTMDQNSDGYNSVTIRDRDSMQQTRVVIDNIVNYVRDHYKL